MALEPLVDIHCHLAPALDDGARNWRESLEMARMAAGDGIGTVICTPRQLGAFPHNDAARIRQRVAQLQSLLDQQQIPLRVLPGADVHVDQQLSEQLEGGRVLTLGDHGRHVLLQLPNELYFPLDSLLDRLQQSQLVGILSHPERNQGLLSDWGLVEPLVERGCLMQLTAGSLQGDFGPASQDMARWMLEQDLVHFVASDAHGPRHRRPLLRRAYYGIRQLAGEEQAELICVANPQAVAQGAEVHVERRVPKAPWFSWLRRAA